MKKCSTCKIIKDKSEFDKQSCKPDGLRCNCKTCRSIKSKEIRSNLSEERKLEISLRQKIRHFSRSEEQKDIDRKRNNEVYKERYNNDINFKIAHVLRVRLIEAIKNDQKAGSAVNDLGCSIKELKIHIESLWQTDMNWENHTSDGWHIDHIKPLCSFDLSDFNQLKEACNYTNLQPMWYNENMSKGGKYE